MAATMTELKEKLEPYSRLGSVVVPRRGGHAELVVDEEEGEILYRASGNEYSLSDEALEQVFTHVPGMSKAALAQWPEELLLTTVNWFLANQAGEVRAITMGDQVVSFPKKDVPIHYPLGVVDAIENALVDLDVDVETLEAHAVRTGIDRVMFSLVHPEKVAEPRVDDIVQGGLFVQLSPTGNAHIELSPYVNRLVCTNGQISPVNLGRWSWRGDTGSSGDGSFLDWVGSFTTESWTALDDEFAALHSLTEMKVNGHTQDVLRDLFNRHRVPSSVRDEVMAAALDEADGTMYGIAQSFNLAANRIDNDGYMRHLWMVTGEIAHQTDRCGECFRALN